MRTMTVHIKVGNGAGAVLMVMLLAGQTLAVTPPGSDGGLNKSAGKPFKNSFETFRSMTQNVETTQLTLATLNIGGDGPQPEYINNDWDSKFGLVEKSFGAEILYLHKCEGKELLKDCKIDEQYSDRYKDDIKTIYSSEKPNGNDQLIEVLTSAFPENKKTLKQELENELEKNEVQVGMTLSTFVSYIMGSELKGTKGLSSLDNPNAGDCKKRMAFPFFDENFIMMFNMLNMGTFTLKHYYGEKQCKFVKSGHYVMLVLFDLYVLKHFKALYTKRKITLEPCVFPSPTELVESKNKLIDALLEKKPTILMLQEAESGVNANKAENDWQIQTVYHRSVHGSVPGLGTAIKGDIDTAILAKGLTEYKKVDWNNFVKECLDQGCLGDEYLTPGDGTKLSDETLEPKKQHLKKALQTTIAIKNIADRKVLLMSMHPNSNGRPCVLFAHLAKKFFLHLNDNRERLDLLLVGMDANVMVQTDKNKNRKKPGANGFTWNEFKEKVEYLNMLPIFQEDKNGEALPTVNKIRTFLQTQTNKAAKVDRTTKDVFLAYPQSGVTVLKTNVWNQIDKEQTFGLINTENEQFPSTNWVLDHFAFWAEIEIAWGKSYNKQTAQKALDIADKYNSAVRSHRKRGKSLRKHLFKFVKKLVGRYGTDGTSN